VIVFQPHDALDRVFAVSIILKGLDGLLELLAGLALLLISTEQVEALARQVTGGAVGTLLPDAVSTWATTAAERLTASGLAFGAFYLLAHGVVKIVLVAALLRNKLWAYPWMIVVLIGFVLFQSYEMVHHPAVGLAVLTIFDLIVIVLTAREYGRQRRGRQPAVRADVPDDDSQLSACG
jgi:uncharacterized membrane protein